MRRGENCLYLYLHRYEVGITPLVASALTNRPTAILDTHAGVGGGPCERLVSAQAILDMTNAGNNGHWARDQGIDPTGTYHGDSDLQLERINVYS